LDIKKEKAIIGNRQIEQSPAATIMLARMNFRNLAPARRQARRKPAARLPA
jgi:hypothetical protein